MKLPSTMPEKTFISYSRSDAEFALRLAKDLRAAQIDVWIDQLDIRPGDMWDQIVEAALRESANVLVVLSPAAVASRSVMDEVAFALEENKRVLPVVQRECTIPFRLRRVQFTDFTSSYDEGLQRLIGGLADPDAHPPSPDDLSGTPEERQLSESHVNEEIPRGTDAWARWPWLSRHPRLGTAVLFGAGGMLTAVFAIAILPWERREWLIISMLVVEDYLAYFTAGAIAGRERAARLLAIGTAAVAFPACFAAVSEGPTSSIDALAVATFMFAPVGVIAGATLGRFGPAIWPRRRRARA